MRVLQIIWSLRRGGAEKVCVDLSRGLWAKGHQVAIATLADVNEWRDIDASFETIPVLPGRFPRWRKEILPLAIRLGRVINIFAPDIVHTHCLASTVAAWLSGHPPQVVTIHGTRSEPIGPRTGFLGNFNRFLFRCSVRRFPALIVATTPESIPRIRTILGVDVSRVRNIWNGVDVEKFWKRRERRVSPAKLEIGMVGSLVRAKNHEFAIQGLRAIREKGRCAILRICGEGPQRPFLEGMVSHFRLRNSVVFEGVVRDIPSFLWSVDVFWMTSHYEGHPIALLEAMAAGAPCIVTDVPGLGSFVREWQCALIVPASDPGELASATLRMWADPAYAESLADRAHDLVSRHFTAGKMVDGYERLYGLAKQS